MPNTVVPLLAQASDRRVKSMAPRVPTVVPASAAWFWRFSCAISWTYAFLSSLSADQSWEYCGSCPTHRNRAGGWASLTAPEYGYQKFDALVRSLKEQLAPDDEQDEQQDHSRISAGTGASGPWRRAGRGRRPIL